MRKTCGSSKTLVSSRFSACALARSRPNGFSMMTFDWWRWPTYFDARPLAPRFWMIGAKTVGGVEI